MKRYLKLTGIFMILGVMAMSLFACGKESSENKENTQSVTEQVSSLKKEEITYEQITPEKAKEIMDSEEDYVIIDSRTQEEYDQGHIAGAVMIPEYEIANRAEEEIPGKDTLILVYCRSGRRSKIASQALVDLGYTNVKEFGGIIDWPYETEK